MRKTFKLAGYLGWLLMVPAVCLATPPSLWGELTQGGLIRGQTDPRGSVFFDGQPLRVSPEGFFVFGLGRAAPALSTLRIDLPDGRVVNRTLHIRPRKYEVQRIDNLDERKVNPKPEDLRRIRKEDEAISHARRRDDPRVDFAQEFLWPVHGVVTGVYGSQRILNGRPRRPHFGVDIMCRAGGTVRAPAAGIVSLAHSDMFFSGRTLVIDHGHGVSSSFLHLEEVLVDVDEQVEQGQPVATVGASGRVTGAHLDWRMNWFSVRVDPSLLVGKMPPPSPGCQG